MGNFNMFKTSMKTFFVKLNRFIYNKETKKILGRTWLSWGQILGFYLVFFTVVGSYFAVHLSVFVAVTPGPRENVTPWNFGQYAYANYPNSKIGVVAIPPVITANSSRAILPDVYRTFYEELLSSANQSQVNDMCLNASTNYGFDYNYPCILLHLSRVYEWTPEDLYQFLDIDNSLPSHLNISCRIDSSVQGGDSTLTWEPHGIPLQLDNNEGNKSFPYRNQPNYITPVVGVRLNITANTLSATLPTRLRITCGLNLQLLSAEEFSQGQIDRIYELPTNATITILLVN